MAVSRKNASLSRDRFVFVPLRPGEETTSLRSASLAPKTELLLFTRGEERRALLMREMSYHHIAQGDLAGEPYLVSF